jgi:hypothetical protein
MRAFLFTVNNNKTGKGAQSSPSAFQTTAPTTTTMRTSSRDVALASLLSLGLILGTAPAASAGDLYDECRRDPTWSDLYNSCWEQTGWDPRDDLWRDSLNRFEYMVLSECVDTEIAIVLEQFREDREALSGGEGVASPTTLTKDDGGAPLKRPQAVNVYPSRENPLAVEITDAFSEHEAAAVLATATCVRRFHAETHLEDRAFTYGYGGNNVTCKC